MLEEVLSKVKQEYGVLSLFNDKSNAIDNIHMWSLYADGMRGFCLEFSKEKLTDSLIEKSRPDNNVEGESVNYQNEPIEINLLDSKELKVDKIIEMMSIKNDIFTAENEYRYICNNKGYNSYSVESLKAIYIGNKAKQEEKELLEAIVKSIYPDAKINYVEISKNNYSIEKL
ncbi:hypothetical protein CJF42_26270 [Pseudoalteromonas sp. NBT06-2]|nr:hypothetical protein CJF42_26270 [Pseudoalteromonas sp. NBT06-2]